MKYRKSNIRGDFFYFKDSGWVECVYNLHPRETHLWMDNPIGIQIKSKP